MQSIRDGSSAAGSANCSRSANSLACLPAVRRNTQYTSPGLYQSRSHAHHVRGQGHYNLRSYSVYINTGNLANIGPGTGAARYRHTWHGTALARSRKAHPGAVLPCHGRFQITQTHAQYACAMFKTYYVMIACRVRSHDWYSNT